MKKTLLMLLGAIVLTFFTFNLPIASILNSGLFEVLTFWLFVIFLFSFERKW
ncbi:MULTISPECIES: hypothetical protein [Bacillus]|nr:MULTISPECIES: hypothetical protein [Bacillus]